MNNKLKSEINKSNKPLLDRLKDNIDNLFFLSVILNFVILVINIVFLSKQELLSSQYLSVGGDYFGDFFESMFFSVKEDLYQYGNIYPPFCYMILYLVSKIYPDAKMFYDPYTMRDTQAGRMIYISVIAICLLVIAFCILQVAKAKPWKKVLTLFSILFTLPMFVLIDRDNILLISLVFSFIFVVFYDSENKVLREIALISLAIASAIKIYPAVLGVLLIKRGNIKVISRTVIYGVFCFFVPFAFFGGTEAFVQFVHNLQAGVAQRRLVEGSINCEVNLSSAVSTIYRLFVHHPTEAQYAVIEKFSRCLSYILAIQFIAGSFLSKTKWKKVLSLSAIILIIPDFSYSYCIASYLPAIMMYIAETKRKKSDLLYLIPFICLTVPYGINLYDYFFKVFEVGTRYSVVCQNLAQVVIFVVLFIEIVIMEINYNKNDKITVLYLKRRKGKNSEKTFILNRLTVNKIGFVIILMKDKKTDLNFLLRSVFLFVDLFWFLNIFSCVADYYCKQKSESVCHCRGDCHTKNADCLNKHYCQNDENSCINYLNNHLPFFMPEC